MPLKLTNQSINHQHLLQLKYQYPRGSLFQWEPNEFMDRLVVNKYEVMHSIFHRPSLSKLDIQRLQERVTYAVNELEDIN